MNTSTYNRDNDLLKPLKGLQGHNDEDIEKWKLDNAAKIRKYGLQTDEDLNRLYMMQQVKSAYGNKYYKSLMTDDDNTNAEITADLYKDMVVTQAFFKRFDPHDTNYIGINPSKGLGLMYDEIDNTWTTDEKLKLLESGYMTPEEIDKNKSSFQKIGEQYWTEVINNPLSMPLPSSTGIYSTNLIASADEEGIEKTLHSNSAAILHDLKKEHNDNSIVGPLNPKVSSYLDSMKISDSATTEWFENYIKMDGINAGIPTYAAFYRSKDEDKITEFEDFGVADMKYIKAQVDVYRKYGVPENTIREILEDQALDYVYEHRPGWKSALLFGKDVAVAATAYTGQKIQSVGQLGRAFLDATTGKVDVYIDNEGNVIPNSKVQTVEKGRLSPLALEEEQNEGYSLPSSLMPSWSTQKQPTKNIEYESFYVNNEGKRIPVKKIKKSRTELGWMGKDSDGEDLPFLLNPQTLEKAQKYNTFDTDYIKEADRCGTSIYSPNFGSSREEGVLYSAGKMVSFAVADYGLNLIGGGAAKGLSWANKAVQSTNRVARAAGWIGKVSFGATSKLLDPRVQSFISAGGIGYAYGVGGYNETYQDNLDKFKQNVYNNAVQTIENDIKQNNESFAAEVRAIKQQIINELVEKKGQEEAYQILSTNKEYFDEQAKQIAYQQKLDKELERIQNTEEYFHGLNEASANASMAANNVTVLDGAKYAVINTWGYRKFLFKNPDQRLATTITSKLKKARKNIQQFGKDIYTKKYGNALGKTKQLGKAFWKQVVAGGGLTNFTDDMQTDAAEFLAGQAFQNYLTGYNNGAALDTYSSFCDAMLGMINGDYIVGGIESLGQGTTWRAGAVGMMGSALPTHFVATATYNSIMKTEDYKQALQEAKDRGVSPWKTVRFYNALVQSGILNEYYAEKDATKKQQQAIDKGEDYLKNPEFKNIVRDIIKAGAYLEEDKEVDKRTADFLQALNTVRGLIAFDKYEHKGLENMDYVEERPLVDALITTSQTFQETKALWDNLINGEITEAQQKNIIEEYYANNPSVERSAENNAKALEQVTKNAAKLNEALERMNKAEQMMSEVEKKNKNKERFDSETRAQIVILAALDDHMSERISNMEKEISGSETNEAPIDAVIDLMVRGNSGDAVGLSRKAIETERAAIEKSLEESNEKVTKYETLVKEISDKLEKESDPQKIKDAQKSLSDASKDLHLAKRSRSIIESQLEANRERQSNLESAISEFQAEFQEKNPKSTKILSDKEIGSSMTVERLFGFKVNPNSKKSVERASKVLKKLNPYTRARLFKALKTYKDKVANKDVDAVSPFEGKLGEVLEAVYNNIAQNDASIIDKIIDVPTVMSQQQLTQNEISEALSNPAAYMYERSKVEEYEQNIAHELFNSRVTINMASTMEQIHNAFEGAYKGKRRKKALYKKEKEKEKRALLRKYLSQYKSDHLKRLLDIDSPVTNTYRTEIQEVMGLTKAFESIAQDAYISAVTRGLNAESAKIEATNIIRTVGQIAEQSNATTKEGLMTALQEVSEAPNISQASRDLAADAYDLLERLDNQEHSTVSTEELEQSRKERLERRKKAKEDYENRLKVEAEKENTRRAEEAKKQQEEKRRKLEEERAKQAATDKVTNKGNAQIVEHEDGTIDFYGLNPDGTRSKKRSSSLSLDKSKLVDTSNIDNIKDIRAFKFLGEKDGKYQYECDVHYNSEVSPGVMGTEIKNETLEFTEPVHEKAIENIKTEAFKEEVKEQDSKETAKGVADGTIEMTNTQAIELGTTFDETTGEAYIDTPKMEASEAASQGHAVEAPSTTVSFSETKENTLEENDNEYIGNPLYRYDFKQLKEDGYLVEREGASKGDKLNQFFGWMNSKGIKYQEIIDNELSEILSVTNEVHFVLVKPDKNNPFNSVMQKEVLTAVKYTPEVAKLHHEEYGGVIEANGEKYLIIGTTGYRNNGSMADMAHKFQDKLKANRTEYLKNNPDAEFYVEPSMTTTINNITPGYIVRKLSTDAEVKVRTLGELLADKERNPDGLELEDTKWLIQKNGVTKTIGINTEEFRGPSAADANVGNVFMLVKSASGVYIPVAMKTVPYSKMRDGYLKSQVMEALTELTSTNFKDRDAAAKKLREIFYLDKTDKTVLYGNENGVNVLTLVDGGVKTRSFDLTSPTFNRMEFFKAFAEIDPIVNLTASVLSSPTTLQVYDQAGVLLTDAAKIGTSGAQYSMAAVDANGNVFLPTAVESNSHSRSNSELSRAAYPSVVVNKEVYRYKKDRWVDATDKPITDSGLLNTIQYNYSIENGKMSPIYSTDKVELFLLDANPNALIMVSRNKNSKAIRVLTQEEAKRQLDGIETLKEKQRQAEEAKSKLEELKRQQEEADKELSEQSASLDNLVDYGEDFSELIGLPSQDATTETQVQTEKKEEAHTETPSRPANTTESKPKSLEDYRKAETKTSSLGEIMANREASKKFRDVLKTKAKEAGWVLPKPNEMENFLKEKGIITDNIKDFDSWLEEIKNCM